MLSKCSSSTLLIRGMVKVSSGLEENSATLARTHFNTLMWLILNKMPVHLFFHRRTAIPREEVYVISVRHIIYAPISAFSFRAAESDGLIFYHGALVDNSSEYMAFELLDGHLFMVIDLGAGPIRLQVKGPQLLFRKSLDHRQESDRRYRLAQCLHGEIATYW